MQQKSITRCWIVPVGYTFSWFFGILIGANVVDWFFNDNLIFSADPSYLLFSSEISVYCAFLLECCFIFIDWGVIYKDEGPNGKIFFVFAGIFFHFFFTLCLVGSIISHLDDLKVNSLLVWVLIFKLGISLLSANAKYWISDICIHDANFNKIK